MASQLEGVADLTRKLTDMKGAAAGKELRAVVKLAMQETEHKARARIPQGKVPHKTYRGRLVSPGFAASQLYANSYVDKKTGSAVAILGVGREGFYATIFVELGTARMQAQPWLRPSFEESQDPMLRIIAEELKKRVERIAKRRAAKGLK